MNAGDIILTQRETGEWAATKILAVDAWPDGDVFHCLCYKATPEKPTPDGVGSLEVLVYHAPIAAEGFRQRAEVLCSTPITNDERRGFFEYLKMTDYARYLEVTGQDVEVIVAQANALYREACALDQKGQKQEAIAEYSKAIDLFPLLYEAIDNRGLTFMELGDHASALEDFESSLRVNPKGSTAFAARGDCLLALGQLEQARQVFEEGSHRFPEHQDFHRSKLAQVQALLHPRDGTAKSSAPKRPWWKFH